MVVFIHVHVVTIKLQGERESETERERERENERGDEKTVREGATHHNRDRKQRFSVSQRR